MKTVVDYTDVSAIEAWLSAANEARAAFESSRRRVAQADAQVQRTLSDLRNYSGPADTEEGRRLLLDYGRAHNLAWREFTRAQEVAAKRQARYREFVDEAQAIIARPVPADNTYDKWLREVRAIWLNA